MLRNLLSEFRLYLCNHFVNKIPIVCFRMWFYRRVMKFSIGKNSYIFLGCTFDDAMYLKMGNNSVINSNCRVDTRGFVEIGDNCSISSNVIILTADHDMDTPDMQGRNKKVILDDYTWIGTSAMILPGVIISKGAVVAAKALVSKNVASFQVVGGVPAKFIRDRKITNNFSYNAGYKRLFQ